MGVIPYAFHTFRDYQPAGQRWDQLHLARVLAGLEGRPPGGYEMYEADYATVMNSGGVLVLPVGAYRENDDHHDVLYEVSTDLNRMPWGIVFATSDEANTFPWYKIDPWPDDIQLYVQLPRSENTYPVGTRFFGEGSPTSAVEIQNVAALTRDLDIFLSAQGGHERRDQCFEALHLLEGHTGQIERTEGFTQGMDRDEYLFHLTRTWIAPAPSGICSPSSFRAFEALEAGCIPIVDGIRPGGGGGGYWEMLGMGDFLPVIDDWSYLPGVVDDLLVDRSFKAARISAGWQQWKRRFVADLHASIAEHSGIPRPHETPHDDITVIIPTSPVPSNPDLSMIQEVIASIRTDLPGAEILITCDGVRREQEERRDQYHVFLHHLAVWCLTQHNVTPFVYDEHLHQSGMLQQILPEVATRFSLYVEGDCPIIAPVPWADLIATMDDNDLNSLRLLHETHILDSHEHLYPTLEPQPGPAPWLPTMQWSQRPHLARTDWYVDLMHRYFGPESRTMVEDVMHGVVQHGWVERSDWTFTNGISSDDGWNPWKLGVYAPEGNMKRSGHLDGRGDDPKYRMKFVPPEDPLPGTPREGWLG